MNQSQAFHFLDQVTDAWGEPPEPSLLSSVHSPCDLSDEQAERVHAEYLQARGLVA